MEINSFKQAVHSDKLLCDIFDRGNGFSHKLPGILPPEGITFRSPVRSSKVCAAMAFPFSITFAL
ncbi:MAG TPA: hypothetical protein VF360_08330 [Candidatus Methanoperedens sp.]